MTRDDSTGGWVPMGGGGLSYVGLVKRKLGSRESIQRNEYLIYGQRIADNTVVLKCDVKKDIRYTKPNPKFHHWHIDDKKFGLTFERYDDARAFDKCIRAAVEDLRDGYGQKVDTEEDVFGELELPISQTGSSSQSTNSTTTSSPQSPTSFITGVPESFYTNSHHNNSHSHHLHRVHYVPSPHSRHKRNSPQSEKSSSKSDSFESREDVWVKADEPTSISVKSDQGLLDSISDNVELKEYSYVIFARKQQHEYSYPNLEPVPKPPSKREREAVSSSKNKNSQITTQPKPPLPVKIKKKDKRKNVQMGRLITKARCKHCHISFSHEDNQRGSCEEAPDGVDKCIEVVTCVLCTKGLIYHCMSDADGEYGHPCMCDSSDESNCKKWTALSILSFFVPCLWCYWPLKACHMCGMSCGCCGGRHKAS